MLGSRRGVKESLEGYKREEWRDQGLWNEDEYREYRVELGGLVREGEGEGYYVEGGETAQHPTRPRRQF